MSRSLFERALGRYLLAFLFVVGAIQKATDPSAVKTLLADSGLATWLIWPAFAFNLIAAILLIADRYTRAVSYALAAYCIITSVFHFIPSDPWQMSILVKNWAIAGGFLVLAASQNQDA